MIELLDQVIDVSLYCSAEERIIASSVDKKGVNVLTIHHEPQYRTKDGSFSIVKRDEPNGYSFYRFDLTGDLLFSTPIHNEKYNIHHALLLPYDEILLVSGRCRYRGKTDIDKNARVYDTEGDLKRAFTIGDGIEDIKVDSQGQIWVSYFDEGIFGNYGWDDPLGAPGLICWSNTGDNLWEFEPIDGLDEMADCYAMNLDADDNVWFYYYTEFPLVKLSPDKQLQQWNSGLSGSHSVHISGDLVLMSGDYDSADFVLFEMKEKKMKRIAEVQFRTAEEKVLGKRELISSMGSTVAFLDGKKIFFKHL